MYILGLATQKSGYEAATVDKTLHVSIASSLNTPINVIKKAHSVL